MSSSIGRNSTFSCQQLVMKCCHGWWTSSSVGWNPTFSCQQLVMKCCHGWWTCSSIGQTLPSLVSNLSWNIVMDDGWVWPMYEFIHWLKPYLLVSAICHEILSWMIDIWMKNQVATGAWAGFVQSWVWDELRNHHISAFYFESNWKQTMSVNSVKPLCTNSRDPIRVHHMGVPVMWPACINSRNYLCETKREEMLTLVGSTWLKCLFDPHLVFMSTGHNISDVWLLTPLGVGTVITRVTKVTMGT